MANWEYQTITDETMNRLPECRWHKLGGWLLIPVIQLSLQAASGILTATALILGLARLGGAGTDGAAALMALYTIPVLFIGVTLLLLFMRKLAFRIPYTIHASVQLGLAAMRAVGGGNDWPANALAALAFGLGIVYVFTSDRVRVFCNRRPKRPVPMPAREAAPEQPGEPNWDDAGLVYTDEKGNVTNFSDTARIKTRYRFSNLPSGWRQTAGRIKCREE